MTPDRDPWSSGGQATRREVREIFARHAAHAGGPLEAAAERRSAVPGILRLPARLWRLMPGWGRVATGALLLALAAAVAVLLPQALETAADNRENERRAAAANLEQIRQDLIESQRPRRAVLERPTPAALAAVVGEDFKRRVESGDLEGPAGPTTCRPVRPQPDRAAIVFTCVAERGSEKGVYLDRRLVSGYRFKARVVRATGAAAWCKENPRPLHADQEEFVIVPLSRACTG